MGEIGHFLTWGAALSNGRWVGIKAKACFASGWVQSVRMCRGMMGEALTHAYAHMCEDGGTRALFLGHSPTTTKSLNDTTPPYSTREVHCRMCPKEGGVDGRSVSVSNSASDQQQP